MTSQTSKNFCIVLFALFLTATGAKAQVSENNVKNDTQLSGWVQKAISGVKPGQAETVLDALAKLQRVSDMQPDSALPKTTAATLCLKFAISNPSAKESQTLIESAQSTISQLEKMPAADASDVATLWGFYYLTLIVQDPMHNGPAYYQTVPDYLNKALKLNPDNQLARQLLEGFEQGMKQAIGQ